MAVWFILALAVIVVPSALCNIFLSGIVSQPPEVREDPRGSLRAAAPEWTPDGSRIVFGHEGSVYVVNQNGSALSRIHGSDGKDDLYHTPILYRDGSWIGYSKYRRGRWTRQRSTLDGSEVRETDQNFDDRGFNAPWGYRPYGISPDGSRIAFVETETRGAERKYVGVLYASEYPWKWEARSGWAKLAEGAGIGSPRWSPDGRRIAFVETDGIPNDSHSLRYLTRVVSRNGSDLGTVHQAIDRSSGHYEVSWSPDGTKPLISGADFVSAANSDGSGSRTLVNLYPLLKTRELIASWSPDGSKIAVYNGGGYEGALFTISPDGSNKRVLALNGNPLRPAQNQAWDPAYDAPTPTPAPIAMPKPATVAPSPTAKPRAPASAPTPASGSGPAKSASTPLTRTGGGKLLRRAPTLPTGRKTRAWQGT